MKSKLIATALLVTPLVGFVANRTLPLEPTSTLSVEGGSTVRGWKCAAKKIDAEIAVSESASVAELVNGATVTIPVAQLDCGNGTMNEHMRKALKAAESPAIRFTLASYTLAGSSATLEGSLEIAGSSKPIQIPATVTETGSGVVQVKASKTINMKEWGVKPPSLMMGTMKVKENVTVNFDVALKK